MNWIYRLERKLGRNFGVSNIMLFITATILALYALSMVILVQGHDAGLYGLLYFDKELIFAGEFWRIISFVLVHPNYWSHPLFVLLTLYVAYNIGTNLERVWGKALFNLYLIFGILGAIAAGLITGFGTTAFIFSSLILAFCYMNPSATILLFFILPVRARFIAIFTWLVTRTPLGRAMRACEQDLKMAGLLGIDTDRTISLTFVIGAALAAVAGLMFLLYYGVIDFFIGFVAGVKAFTAAVLGGIGSLPGAVLGGLLIGLIEVFWSAYFSVQYKDVAAFSILAITLIFLPTGLLGRADVEKV